jgi:hypothetical protein
MQIFTHKHGSNFAVDVHAVLVAHHVTILLQAQPKQTGTTTAHNKDHTST